MANRAWFLRIATSAIVALLVLQVFSVDGRATNTEPAGLQKNLYMQALGNSGEASISANGRFVAFTSDAINLIFGDANGGEDVYLRDRLNGVTERISISSVGEEGYGISEQPSLTADGRFVAFVSYAGLVPDDDNLSYWGLWPAPDIYIRDRINSITERISVSSEGQGANQDSYSPSISADGRYIAFASIAGNLVPNDTNGSLLDVFLRDRVSSTTELVSVSTGGQQGNFESFAPSISANGQFVAFSSTASNLVAGDTNNAKDVFLHDRLNHTTERISVSSLGKQGNDSSGAASISADGRFIAFQSYASNLFPGDTNGAGDIFVYDRVNKNTVRVSFSILGQEGTILSLSPSISADGRFIAYATCKQNTIGGCVHEYSGTVDYYDGENIYVYDRVTGTTRWLSEHSDGDSWGPVISADGRFVAFTSLATNLIPNYEDIGSADVFVQSLVDGTTELVSVGIDLDVTFPIRGYIPMVRTK